MSVSMLETLLGPIGVTAIVEESRLANAGVRRIVMIVSLTITGKTRILSTSPLSKLQWKKVA